jgi:hypothetical protein
VGTYIARRTKKEMQLVIDQLEEDNHTLRLQVQTQGTLHETYRRIANKRKAALEAIKIVIEATQHARVVGE